MATCTGLYQPDVCSAGIGAETKRLHIAEGESLLQGSNGAARHAVPPHACHSRRAADVDPRPAPAGRGLQLPSHASGRCACSGRHGLRGLAELSQEEAAGVYSAAQLSPSLVLCAKPSSSDAVKHDIACSSSLVSAQHT